MKSWPERLSAVGSVVAAAACPVCFPKLALLGALFGFGAFAAYESQIFVIAQVLVLLTVLAHGIGHLRRRRNPLRLAAVVASGALVFAGLYLVGSEWVAYLGFAGLVAASVFEFRGASTRMTPREESRIKCPQCGLQRIEIMPRDACLFFYECKGCGAVLRPKTGDCCVFCSYGSVKCPSRQLAQEEIRQAGT